MDHRPTQSSKVAAKELAHLITSRSDDRLRMLELLSKLELPERSSPVVLAVAADNKDVTDRIGIWKAVQKNGAHYYERDPGTQDEWLFWADINKFYPKGEKKRVILIGESVARGYLYSPFYTVAQELEAILNQEIGGYEVLDMAKVGMDMNVLKGVAGSCSALEPDAVLIFAGNNWFAGVFNALSGEEYEQLLRIYERELFQGIKAFLEKKFAAAVEDLLKEISASLVAAGIPVVFLIPEFNLRDWTADEMERIFPWSPGDAIEKSIEAAVRAEQALVDHDNELLEITAGQMVALDPSNPRGHELLAEACIMVGRNREAIACFENARDTALFARGKNTTPRCFGIIRKTISERAAVHGILAIDLPAILRGQDGDHIPDRKLFLDYCHFTVEGIKLSMRYAAQALISIMTGRQLSVHDIKASDLDPESDVRAMAYFCAAVHNAHYGQLPEILQYQCREAVYLSVKVKELMMKYVDFATRYSDTVLCRSFEKMILEGNIRQYENGMGFVPPKNHKLLDVDLVDAMVLAFKTAGANIIDKIEALRIKEHAIGLEGTDLLQSYYCKKTYLQFVVEPAPLFLQSRKSKTYFTFVADGKSPISFRIVYRTPGRNYQDKEIAVQVNDDNDPVSRMAMSGDWVGYSFVIGKEQIRKGLNRLTILWPYSSEALTRSNKMSSDSFLTAMFPALGEIAVLTAMAGGNQQQRPPLQTHLKKNAANIGLAG